jgi:ABC-type sugar transport system permease subunit
MERIRKHGLSDVQYGMLLLVPLICFAIFIVAYPIAYSVLMSFEQINFALRTTQFVGGGNYLSAFTDPDVAASFILSVRFIAEVVVGSTALSIGIALVLNESFKGRGIVRVACLLPWSMAGYATAVVWRYILSDQFGLLNAILYYLGLSNQYVAFLATDNAMEWVALAFTWNIAPLGAYFILAGLQVIPQDLYNQAKVDGFSALKRFRSITLPYIRYSVFIVIVLTTLLAATVTDVIIVMTGGGPGSGTSTLAFRIYLILFKDLNLGYAAAISWLLILFTLVLAAIYFILLLRRRTVHE